VLALRVIARKTQSRRLGGETLQETVVCAAHGGPWKYVIMSRRKLARLAELAYFKLLNYANCFVFTNKISSRENLTENVYKCMISAWQ
jgi:hypothetical protein